MLYFISKISDHIYYHYSAGAGQQDVLGTALARIDTTKDPWPFSGLFAERIFQDTKDTITLFVSPNGFDDFLELLEKCHNEGVNFTWFYPYVGSEEPQVPENIRKHVHFLQLKR